MEIACNTDWMSINLPVWVDKPSLQERIFLTIRSLRDVKCTFLEWPKVEVHPNTYQYHWWLVYLEWLLHLSYLPGVIGLKKIVDLSKFTCYLETPSYTCRTSQKFLHSNTDALQNKSESPVKKIYDIHGPLLEAEIPWIFLLRTACFNNPVKPSLQRRKR